MIEKWAMEIPSEKVEYVAIEAISKPTELLWRHQRHILSNTAAANATVSASGISCHPPECLLLSESSDKRQS